MEDKINKVETDVKKEDLKPQEVEPTTEIIPPKKKIKISPLIIVIVLFLIFAIGAAAYYLGTKNSKNLKIEEQPLIENNKPTEEIEIKPLFSGQIKRLNQDLKLFKKEEFEEDVSTVYYSSGVFNKGELKDYTRIIAIKSPIGPGGPSIFILATNDFQKFILNDPENKTKKYPEENWENPYRVLNKNKITSTKIFETEQPKELVLDNTFSLYFTSLLSTSIGTNKVDKNGNKISENVLVTDFYSHQKITSPFDNLTFYFKPSEKSNFFDTMSQEGKNKELLKEKYLSGNTEVIVVDSTGLPVTYLLATSENISNYQQKIENKNQVEAAYISPGLTFEKSKIQNKSNSSFYNLYATAIPAGCSMSFATKVSKITDSELEEAGVVSGLSIYRLKNNNHPLYKLAFDNKMDYYNDFPSGWDELHQGMKKPTLEEYINNNPLLFVKDYWQRWVVLGEYDIKLPGGCGKPVIYLYPQEPTQISVKFNSPVQFTTDIPKYNDSWQVMAFPNGSLKNLKSNSADCQKIDFQKTGSEYAKEACEKNEYPYLYWAGNIYSQNYPEIDKGWIVKKDNLGKFLEDKLSEIGFNFNEKEDFMSYWLPDMMNKNSPYYRISFLQTHELNSLFPMTINPKPDTVFRIFLDYLSLDEKPENEPLPQTLNKLKRQGFTMVEWGGLKNQ